MAASVSIQDGIDIISDRINSLTKRVAAIEAARLIDEEIIGVLLICQRNPEAIEMIWNDVLSESHATRVIRMASISDQNDPVYEVVKKILSERLAHWRKLIPIAKSIHDGESES